MKTAAVVKITGFKRIARIAVAIVMPLVFALMAVTFFGTAIYEVDGVSVRLSAGPSFTGETVLSVPPFGEIAARTHHSPLRIGASLERVYPDKIGKVAREASASSELINRVEQDARKMLKDFAIRLLLLAALGGAFGSLFWTKRLRAGIFGALLGGLVVVGLLGATFATYDAGAFRQPRYSGILSTAPWMTEALADKLAILKTFRSEIQEIAGNVHEFYSKVNSWGPVESSEGDISVLQVSDMHTNPAALDLIERIARDYRVSFIIDTGDATDFGTPLEASFLARIEKLGKPYLFTPGNHDSRASIAALKKLSNVSVLDGSVKVVDGVRVLGIADPASKTNENATAKESELEAAAKELKRAVAGQDVHIATAHNPQVARSAFGIVPVVLTGHTHRPDFQEKDGSVLINGGTTGAAGLRTFREEKGVPYSLQILHFKRNPLRLIAVDTVTLYGLEREFQLERRVVDGPEARDASVAGSR